jgi:multidrug efflux pump subunit AcrA (membrane-fusion protein)
MVRRNAALALAGFGDAAARPELALMLRPYSVKAPAVGVLRYRLKLGDYVNPGTMLAHLGAAELRSPVPGEVRSLDAPEGATVKSGDSIAELAPDQNHVFEALRALYLIGTSADLESVEHFTRPIPGMSEAVVRQARLTLQAIQSRAAAPGRE